jgi:hypothetical protein
MQSLVVALAAMPVLSGCSTSTPERQDIPRVSPASGAESAAVLLTGWFHVMYGDPPPPGHGGGQLRYELVDSVGHSTPLLLSDDLLRSNRGGRDLDRKRVRVTGFRLDHPDTVVRVRDIEVISEAR